MSELWRPSNSTEGMQFEAKFCERCEHDRKHREKAEGGCQILFRAMFLSEDDGEYLKQWIKGENGPECTEFYDESAAMADRKREAAKKQIRSAKEAGQLNLW